MLHSIAETLAMLSAVFSLSATLFISVLPHRNQRLVARLKTAAEQILFQTDHLSHSTSPLPFLVEPRLVQ